MNLYLISQSTSNGYDTYDSAVVAAISIEAAKLTDPNTYHKNKPITERTYAGDWVKNPALVTATLIGKAIKGTQAGVICASFNAG